MNSRDPTSPPSLMSFPCLFHVIPGRRFMPWKISRQHPCLPSKVSRSSPPPTNSPLLLWKQELLFTFTPCASHRKLKHVNLQMVFSELFICRSCFHDARTIGKPSPYFKETFFSSHKKCCKFPLLPFYLGGLATNLSKSFPCRRAVQSTCSRIQTRVTNKYSCLFIGGQ